MAPSLVSLAMILVSGSPGLRRDFLDRLLSVRRIRFSTMPVFILLMPMTVLISIALSLPFGGRMTQFQLSEGFSFSYGFIPVLLILVVAATFEELGWRGYAFESLRRRHGYLASALLFGVLWSLWHLPLIFVKDSYQYEIFHQNIWYSVNFFISIVPLGIIISWICTKNGGSVIAAILFHLIINISQEMLQITQTTKCIQTGLLVVVAGVIIAVDRKLFFAGPAENTELKMSAPSEAGADKLDNPAHAKANHQHGIDLHG